MRKVLDYNLSDRAAADKEAADKEIKAGASRDSVLKKYTSDKSFEKWYKGASYGAALGKLYAETEKLHKRIRYACEYVVVQGWEKYFCRPG